MPVMNAIPLTDDVLRRKLLLKRQAVSILRGDMHEINELLFFRSALRRREQKISGQFDRRLSQEIDALHFLIEEEKSR